MLHHCRSEQIQTDYMIAQTRSKIGCDGFRNFGRRQMNAALPYRRTHERRGDDACRVLTIEKGLDLSISLHALSETRPARAFTRLEYRSHQWKRAARLDQYPRHAIRQSLLIPPRQPAVEIVIDQDDSQVA